MKNLHSLAIIAALTLTGSAAFAQSTVNGLIADLQAQGYTAFEVQNGATQSKVEAVRGTEKMEVVLDRATGTVMKSEIEQASLRDQSRTGIVTRDRSDRDFVRENRSSDDRTASDDRGRGRGSDDRGEDDRGGRRGGDDSSHSNSHDSDHDSDHDSGRGDDSGHGGGNSGSGNSGGDDSGRGRD